MAINNLLINGSSASMNECGSALDCIFQSSDGSHEVFKLCYIGVGEYNFCDCSSWYGFIGVDCNQHSVQTRYFISSLVFFLVAAVILLVFSVFELARHVWFICTNKSSKAKLNVGLALLAANIGGALSIMIYSSVTLRSIIDPSKFELIEYKVLLFDPEPDTTVAHGNLASSGLILANEFFIVAAMQISLSWIDVATDVWKYFDEERQRKVKRTKRFIQILTVSSLSSVLVFLMARLFYAATVIAIINAILLLIMFVYGRWIFVRFVKGISQEGMKENLLKVVALVKYSSILHIFCLGVLILMLILFYATFPSVYENVSAGNFNYVLLFRDLSVIFGTIMQVADTYYVHNLFSRLRKTAANGKPSTTGSNKSGKNTGRKQQRADDDITEASLVNVDANDKATDVVKGPALPFTAGLVRPTLSLPDSLDGLFVDLSEKKASGNTFSRMHWEV